MTHAADGQDGINRRRFLAGGATVAGLSLAPLGQVTRADAAPAVSGQPTGLLTALLDDPLGVPLSGLRMSWIVPALGVAPMQTAYQIQLAASPAAFARAGGLVWDSGRVKDTS